MKKVIRLNENDIENLVRKIISEEKKSINEGPLGWIRKKFNQDEEVGLLIIKALESGEIENVDYRVGTGILREHIYTSVINGHRVEVSYYVSSKSGSDDYQVKVDGDYVELSNRTSKKIYKLMAQIESIPTLKRRNQKLGELKLSLNRYNLSPEERKKIEDPSTYFDSLQ
jgi:hypothetical protein